MAELKMSTDQFRLLARELSEISDELESLNNRLYSAIGVLKSSWDGSEADRIITQLNQIRKAEDERIALIKTLMTIIEKTLTVYTEAEQNMVASFLHSEA